MKGAFAAAVLAAAVVAGSAGSGTRAAFVFYGEPDWSPDGRMIAFESNRDAPGQFNQVYVANADGSNIRRLTNGGTYGNGAPSWAPSSRRLIYGSWDYFAIVDLDGTPVRRIARAAGDTCCPKWSPGGRRIAYTSPVEIGASTIHVVAPDGRHDTTAVKPDGDHAYTNPAWSPDGERLAFSIGREADGGADVQPALGIIASYHGRIKRLLRGRNVAYLDWSPRGRFLALVDLTQNTTWVSTFDLKTRHLRHLHAGLAPTWSPDGRRIAFGYAGAIYVMRADGTDVRRLIG